MDNGKLKDNIVVGVPVHSTHNKVGSSSEWFEHSPRITKVQSFGVEIHPSTGMRLIVDYFFFIYGDRILIAAGMERDLPEEPEDIKDNTFLTWVNEIAQLRVT